MHFSKNILLAALSVALWMNAISQGIERYNIFSYGVNEGLLQTSIGELAIDKNNFCWLSFPNGIQKFDGNNFTAVPVQPGLPDDKMVSFFRCSNGDLLISHSKGISKYEIDQNRFVQVYSRGNITQASIQFIGEDDGIVYFYNEPGAIIGLDYLNFHKVSEARQAILDYPKEYNIRFSNNIINHRVAININYHLYLWDLKKQRLIDSSAAFPDMSGFTLWLRSGDEALYISYKINQALQSYHFGTKKNSTLFLGGKEDATISRSVIFPWQKKMLVSFNSRLYEVDPAFQQLKTELVNFQNQPIGTPSAIANICEDNFGNLYITTLSGGIRKLIRNNYPVKYYTTQKKGENFIVSVLPDKKNNRILAGTDANGLLIFDTMQQLVKHIRILPGQKNAFTVNCIIRDDKENYLLFIRGEEKIWCLGKDLIQLSRLPVSPIVPGDKVAFGYFGTSLFRDGKGAITQSENKFYRTDFVSRSTKGRQLGKGYMLGGIYHNEKIITHCNDELIFIDARSFSELKRIPFGNTGYVRCFTKDRNDGIYVGSNKGIFKIDENGKILQHYTKDKGLPDDCIYAMTFDRDGQLWCSSNKGVFKIKKDNSILQLTKEDGLQENEFNTNAVAQAEDGEIFFGGINGFSSFFPSDINSIGEQIELLVTKIHVNNTEKFSDTAAWKIQKINLPYYQNYLSFDFIAMADNNPGQYTYQYRMVGLDKEWIQNSGLQTIRYFLPPGKYVLQLYASRVFDKEAKPMKEISIVINPPFWTTWWFFTGLAVFFVMILIFTINWYNKRKYEKKLIELESEHKLQLERERISRDLHDSIGAYANAVLYNTELLQKEEDMLERNELMNDLKFASKDIITSLRETIWALKKDNYTAGDCLLRIKNFIQSLARYYSSIQFVVEGEVPSGKELHYTQALNAVRITQEAITNAIKHAFPSVIKVTSKETAGRWNLEITNDGQGFDHNALKEADHGNGLQNMKQRAEDSGFTIGFESADSSGTRISILI